MALMKCPDCKKKISDDVDKCPSCGKIITQDDKIKAFSESKKKKKKNKAKAVIFSLIGIIILLICTALVAGEVKQRNKIKENENQFYENLDLFLSSCSINSANLGTISNELDTVWYNSTLGINEEDMSTTVNNWLEENGERFDSIQDSIEEGETYYENFLGTEYINASTEIIKGFSEELKKEIQAYLNMFYMIDFSYNDFTEKRKEHSESIQHWMEAINDEIEESKEKTE